MTGRPALSPSVGPNSTLTVAQAAATLHVPTPAPPSSYPLALAQQHPSPHFGTFPHYPAAGGVEPTSARASPLLAGGAAPSSDYYKDKYIGELEARVALVQQLAEREQALRESQALISQLVVENHALRESLTPAPANASAVGTPTLEPMAGVPSAIVSLRAPSTPAPLTPALAPKAEASVPASKLAEGVVVATTTTTTTAGPRAKVPRAPVPLSMPAEARIKPGQPPAKRPFRKSEPMPSTSSRRVALGLRDDPATADESAEEFETSSVQGLDDYPPGSLIPWVELISKGYPKGTLSSLRSQDRERIVQCVSDFLLRIGRKPEECMTAHRRQAQVISVPKERVDDFFAHFGEAVDQGLLSAGYKRKRVDSAPTHAVPATTASVDGETSADAAMKEERPVSTPSGHGLDLSDVTTVPLSAFKGEVVEWFSALKQKYPTLKLGRSSTYANFVKQYLARYNLPLLVSGTVRKSLYLPRAEIPRFQREFEQAFPNFASSREQSMLANSVLWSAAVLKRIGKERLEGLIKQFVLFDRAKLMMRAHIRELASAPSPSGLPKPTGGERQIRVSVEDAKEFSAWFEEQFKQDFRGGASAGAAATASASASAAPSTSRSIAPAGRSSVAAAMEAKGKAPKSASPPASTSAPAQGTVFVSRPDLTRYNT